MLNAIAPVNFAADKHSYLGYVISRERNGQYTWADELNRHHNGYVNGTGGYNSIEDACAGIDEWVSRK